MEGTNSSNVDESKESSEQNTNNEQSHDDSMRYDSPLKDK